MNREWTFTECDNEEWVNETFTSKADAITEGKKFFKGKDIVVGQLIADGLNYKIENKEVIQMEKVDFTEQIVADLKAEGFKGDMETEIAKRKNKLQQAVTNLKEDTRNSEVYKGSSADFMNDLLK